MKFEYDQMTINYEQIGSGPPLILLHGWATNLQTFAGLIKHLSKIATIFAIDLPGFGSSMEPSYSYGVEEYCQMLKAFINDRQIENPSILAHSFGGRIAIKYARYNEVPKLILVASAGVTKKSMKVKLKIGAFKVKKRYYQLFKPSKIANLYQQKGSRDYQSASPRMKEILSKVVKNNQKADLAYIKSETLIIWGACDKTTPLKDAYLLNKKIKNSGLVIFDTAGHFCYLEEKMRFNIIVEHFLQGDSKYMGGK